MNDKLKRVTKIIVHPGRAHLDDFLSIAIATQYIKVRHGDRIVLEIERRLPTLDELKNDQVLIFDVGGKHEPNNLNFDHHELEGPTSSFQLFLEYLNIWEEFKSIHLWAERASFMDHNGPNAWAELNGVRRGIVPTLISPIEESIVYLMSNEPINYFMIQILEAVGKYCINLIHEVSKCKEDIRNTHETFITSRGIMGFVFKGEIKQKVFPAASHSIAREAGWDISVTPDDRSDGWALFRFSERSGIDFTLIKDHPDVTFSHRGGFLVKVKKEADISALIDLSLS